jgi:hypothetical protein
MLHKAVWGNISATLGGLRATLHEMIRATSGAIVLATIMGAHATKGVGEIVVGVGATTLVNAVAKGLAAGTVITATRDEGAGKLRHGSLGVECRSIGKFSKT